MAIKAACTYSDGTKNEVRYNSHRSTEATGDQCRTFLAMQKISFAVKCKNAGNFLCGEVDTFFRIHLVYFVTLFSLPYKNSNQTSLNSRIFLAKLLIIELHVSQV